MTTPQEARELAEHYADTSLAKSTLRRLADQVEALTAQLDSYKKDAERYRWLRDTNRPATQFEVIVALKNEIAELRAALAKSADYPELDCTDGAHPAWWRGHDHTTIVFCKKVNEILDGKDDGHGVSNEPWESTRRRLLALAKVEQGEPVEVQGRPAENFSFMAVNPKDADELIKCGWEIRKLFTHPARPMTEKFIDEFLEDYTLEGEDEEGRSGCYRPNETELMIIKDAVIGLWSEFEAHIKGATE